MSITIDLIFIIIITFQSLEIYPSGYFFHNCQYFYIYLHLSILDK